MKKGIFLSIKPEFTKRIELGEKNYEFRKYIPKEKFDILYVYETVPTCSLKYVLAIDKIIEYPNKIPEKGYGNEDFNSGLKKSKFAYHILKVEKLDNPIPLKELKTRFGFAAPQSYAYDTRYPELVDYINTLSKKVVINNEI
jgi:predicted transcriptional regulator